MYICSLISSTNLQSQHDYRVSRGSGLPYRYMIR